MRRILAFIILLGGSVSANTYYVKPSGSDASSGLSWSTPWRSVTKVNAAIHGGDTCYFGPGVYRGQIVPPAGGTSTDRTAYLSGDGATTALSYHTAGIYGGADLKDSTWALYSGSIYRTQAINWANAVEPTENTSMTVVVDDSLYKPQLSMPTGAGQFYYDIANDYLYLWCIGTANPASHTSVESSVRPVVYFHSTQNANYVSIVGFNLRYGGKKIVYFGLGCKSSYCYIDHCNIKYVSGATGGNNACVGFEWVSNYEADNGRWNRIRACSLSYVWDAGGNAQHYKGVSMYSQSHLVVESCYIANIGDGIDFKNKLVGPDSSVCNVARFNTITKFDNNGIDILLHAKRDSVYGNIIVGTKPGIVGIIVYGSRGWGEEAVMNNTLYDLGQPIVMGFDQTTTTTSPCYVKYNIVVNSTIPLLYGLTTLRGEYKTKTTVDSNMYYVTTGTYHWDTDWTSNNWATWQGLGYDLRGVQGTNPGFTNPSTGDFSRPAASTEMNQTYGGRTWTRYGAWQAGGTVIVSPLPLNYIGLDSVRSDFSGESDSLRVRFQTQTQTGNDSVVMAISLTSALPTVNSANRWAKAYTSSRTDTSFAVRAISETGTVIIGGWVKRGTSWSGGKYDTLTLRTPSVAKTLPPAFVQVDSILSDFSAETDSLRFRFLTSSQSWPDSTVMALTTNNTLPTYNQTADRWAKSYRGASRYDTLYVTRAVAETDTIIAGAWIKDNDSGYSAPVYFVFVMKRGLSCACTGMTGNVDGSPDGTVDVADLLALETYLFNGGDPSSICQQQANVDGSLDRAIDVNDLSILIYYLFGGPTSTKPAPCQ